MTKIPIVSVRQSTLLIDGAEKSVKQKNVSKLIKLGNPNLKKLPVYQGNFFIVSTALEDVDKVLLQKIDKLVKKK